MPVRRPCLCCGYPAELPAGSAVGRCRPACCHFPGPELAAACPSAYPGSPRLSRTGEQLAAVPRTAKCTYTSRRNAAWGHLSLYRLCVMAACALQGWHLCIAQPSAAPGVHTTADAHSSHISAQGVGTRCEAVGYMWHVHSEHTRPALCCWVGVEQCSTLQALQMCLSACPWVRVHVDMSTGDLLTPVQHGLSDGCLQLVKRRWVTDQANYHQHALVSAFACACATGRVQNVALWLR